MLQKPSSTSRSEKKLAPSSREPAREGPHAKDPKRYEVQHLCELFGVSKQAYYKHDESKVLARAAREAFAFEYIKEIRMKDPGIGGDKLWHMYRRDFQGNAPIGRDWFSDIIDRHKLKVRLKQGRTNYGSVISRISSSGWMPAIMSFVTCLSSWMPIQRKSSDGALAPRWRPSTH